MRKEVIEYAKTVTRDTLLTEVVRIVENEEELIYVLKALEAERE